MLKCCKFCKEKINKLEYTIELSQNLKNCVNIIVCHEECFKKECNELIPEKYLPTGKCYCCNYIIGYTWWCEFVSIAKYKNTNCTKYEDEFVLIGVFDFCLDCWENMAGKDFFEKFK